MERRDNQNIDRPTSAANAPPSGISFPAGSSCPDLNPELPPSYRARASRPPLSIFNFQFSILLLCVLASCTNPFAPALDNDLGSDGTALGDARTLDGVFQNIRYAYNYRDTLIYGNLLHPDFQFRYWNTERANWVTFNRDEEMRINYNLFKGADQLNLQWNDFIRQEGDSVKLSVTRAYNLTIALQANEFFRIDGQATLQLVRNSINDVWLIRLWSDESNF